MSNKYPVPTSDSFAEQIRLLEAELKILEDELQEVEQSLNYFESQIRLSLNTEILRIRELTELIKKQQEAKKAKRQEQKKKGKNYREPKGLKIIRDAARQPYLSMPDNSRELKRLYKEALIQVHPDKFPAASPEQSDRATAVTIQLIDIYQSGNLNELKDFHEHIISGNALSHVPYQPSALPDPRAMLIFLQKKKEELTQKLHANKESRFYQVLTTYADPLRFTEELRIYFAARIIRLEKRIKGKWISTPAQK